MTQEFFNVLLQRREKGWGATGSIEYFKNEEYQ